MGIIEDGVEIIKDNVELCETCTEKVDAWGKAKYPLFLVYFIYKIVNKVIKYFKNRSKKDDGNNPT